VQKKKKILVKKPEKEEDDLKESMGKLSITPKEESELDVKKEDDMFAEAKPEVGTLYFLQHLIIYILL